MNQIITCLSVLFLVGIAWGTQPQRELTPGDLCSANDADFSEYRYPAKVAVCKRKVSHAEKVQVAAAYGIAESDWKKYEFDHLIPLNAGGSNRIENIWPQPLSEARDKDVVEQNTYNGLSSGDLNQKQALQMIWDWIDEH